MCIRDRSTPGRVFPAARVPSPATSSAHPGVAPAPHSNSHRRSLSRGHPVPRRDETHEHSTDARAELTFTHSTAGSKAWQASSSARGRRRKTRLPRPQGNRARYMARKRARLASGSGISRSAAALTEDLETSGISDTGFSPVSIPNVPGEHSGGGVGTDLTQKPMLTNIEYNLIRCIEGGR